VEPGAIVGLISGITALLAIPVAWIWKLSKWDTEIKSIPTICKRMDIMDQRILATELKSGKLETMIEPFWETVCANIPGILKMHSSPDPLVRAFNGTASPEEIDALKKRINDELPEAQEKDPSRALALTLALWAVKVKESDIMRNCKH
jgi:hypothetical protein